MTGPDTTWMDEALCRTMGLDSNLFHPQVPIGARAGRTDTEQERWAKAVCAECPVREACLRYALDTRQAWGIWGGTTARARRTMRERGLAS